MRSGSAHGPPLATARLRSGRVGRRLDGAPSRLPAVRLALIANHDAGAGVDAARLAPLLTAHGAAVETFAFANGEVGAVEAAAPDRLVVAGGDGTIGPCAALAGRLGIPLAVIPTGTANDFARAQALPTRLREACALAAAGTALRHLELGRLADGRPFVNVASAGLASVAAHRAKPLKPRFGPLAYALGAARAAATANPLPCGVSAGGREVSPQKVFSGRAWQVIVAVSGAFGAGSRSGATDPHDGELDVTVIPAGSRIGLARRAWGLRRGTIAEQRHVTHARAPAIELDLPAGTELNVDGEVVPGGGERIVGQADAYALVVPS
jgi:diacylglycerol kinase (ATP)